MNDHTVNRFYWIMIAITIIIAFAFQGSRGLYETTEGRYTETAREMIESGNYLEPTLGYRPHWTKPPLTYWAIAGGIKIFGRNEWGARFYNAIAFILTVLLVSQIGGLLWNKHVGIVAGIIYSTSIFPVIAMNTVNTDTLLVLWETAAVFSYLKASSATKTKDGRKWGLVMWIFFGLGFLTKGPPALLPLLAILAWHYMNKKPWKLFTLLGIGLFLVVGFWWYAVVSFRHPGLLDYFLGQELFARVATDSFHRNPEWYQPFTMYFPLLTIGAGFWFFYLIKTVMEKHLFSLKVLRDYLRAGKSGAFLSLWISIPLIIFFIAQSRLPLYVLPLYVPVALIIGRGIGNKTSLQTIILIAAISAIVLIGVKGLGKHYRQENNMKHVFSMLNNHNQEGLQVASYLESKLYGLQFYLDGKLIRLSNRKTPWSDHILENFIDHKVKGDSTNKYILFTQQKFGDGLKNMLVAKDVDFKEYHHPGWRLFLTLPTNRTSNLCDGWCGEGADSYYLRG